MAEGFQDTWKGKLGRLRWMNEAESGGKDNSIFRAQIYMKHKCLNTKSEKLSKVSSTLSHPSSCASWSHLVTAAPFSDFHISVFPIPIGNLA